MEKGRSTSTTSSDPSAGSISGGSTSPAGQARRRYDGSRRQADADERKRRVVDVARRLFLEQGYGSTSIADIAKEAGVSGPFVYAAFESKVGILSRVADVAVAGDHAEEGLVREREDYGAIFVEGLPPRERIRRGAEALRIVHARSADVTRLVDSVAGIDESARALSQKLIAGAYDDALVFTRILQADGVKPGVPTEDLAAAILTVLSPQSYASLVFDQGWTPERYETWAFEVLGWMLLGD